MNINGKNGLACITNLNDLREPIVLKPLPGLPVIRDLIVDMTQFFKQYESIKPYLQNSSVPPEKERKQSPQQREELDGLYECILCACCSTAVLHFGGTLTSLSVPQDYCRHTDLSRSRDDNTAERLDNRILTVCLDVIQ